MAMFGFLNPNRPGAGVAKDAPEKKAFFHFFEVYFRKFWKLMVVNLLYVLISLPVVTRGLAQVGMTVITRNYAREKHAFLPSDFFEAIKKNWGMSLIFGLLELIIGAILGYGLYFYVMGATIEFSLGTIIPIAIALFMTIMFRFAFYYVYLQIVTFKMSFRQIVKNSVLFAMAGVKQNVVVLLTEVFVAVLCVLGLWLFPGLATLLIIIGYVLIYPAFRSILTQFAVFPLVKKAIIDPYYKEHPGEDLDKRRDLNIEPDAEELQQEGVEQPAESIFTDTLGREEPEAAAFPKQYNERDLRRGKKIGKNDADDDTI